MGPAARRSSPDRSRSPSRKRRTSPGRKSSTKSYYRSPTRARSRSPEKEIFDDTRSSRKNVKLDSRISHHTRSRSPPRERSPHLSRRPRRDDSSSGSPSPRTRRLSRAQADREAARVPVGEDKKKTKDKMRNRRAESSEDDDHRNRYRLKSNGRDEAGRSRSSSGSPSPRTKRLRRAQADREEVRVSVGDDKKKNKDRMQRRSDSPEDDGRRDKYRSQSDRRDEAGRAREYEIHGDDEDSIARMKAAEEALEEKQKQKPSFELSGKLAEETNRVRGVTLLFTEPADARKPDVRWRLYVFKGGEALSDPLYVHRQSCYLFGRERRVADIPTDHPSCSKQHAVLQFRLVETEQADGFLSKKVRPYLMDLGSTNGTFINDDRIEPQRYYELREKDVIKFGNSSREYVMLHENSVK